MSYKKISQGSYNLNVASRDVEIEPPLPVKRDLSLAYSVAKERVENNSTKDDFKLANASRVC